jgi:predicted nucleotidyltransferase
MGPSQKIDPREIAIVVSTVRAAVEAAAAIYVFGSRAGDAATPASDVDIAVLAPRPIETSTYAKLRGELESALRKDVDLVDLRRASTVLRAQVVSTGRLIHDGDTAERERFEDLAFSAYAHLNEERCGILERIRAEGRIHGR